ncbi:MAG: hypothetical protein HLX51_14785 [Micrococcaceae bacterium]|nr:hypothetical protein [Micrococcaceae bacterium]
MSDLAERTDRDLGDALSDLQPLLQQLQALTGDDGQAAAEAQNAVEELSEDELATIDEAATFVNDTCELSVLL